MRYILLTVMTVFIYVLVSCPTAMAAEAGDGLEDMTEVLDVRVSDGEERLRIVVDTSRSVEIKKMVLSNPDRVVVDIKNAWVSPKAKRDGPLKGNYASKLRVAQFDKSTVRVVVELAGSGGKYNIFTMEGGDPPGRVVLDFGDGERGSEKAADPKVTVEETDPVLKEASGNRPSPDKTEKVDERKDKHEDKDKHKDKDKQKDKKKDKDKDKDKKGQKEESENKSGKTTDQEISDITALKGRSITIDPGHGGSDSGAIGPTGVMEKNLTLRISLELEKLLKAEGATVYMTRTKDTEVSPKKAYATDVEELQARCDIANKHKTDIFVSIHMDSFTNRTAKGTTGYYYARGSAQSRELADKIRANLVDQLGTQSRGTQTCNFYVVRHTDMPATLIEVAFVSNPEEEKLLDSKEGVKKAAMAIADGIADYFG